MKMFEVSREPGFRINGFDLLLLAGAASATTALRLAGAPGGTAWIPAYVAASFFLFCNVFRTPTRLELTWAAVCIATIALGIADGEIAWPRVLAVTETLRAAIVFHQLRTPGYRGVFSGS